MTEREKHLELRKKPFIVPEQIQLIFNQDELGLLEKYGSWMEGLYLGRLDPLTDTQKDFIKSVKEDKPPKEEMFNVFWKYIKRRELVESTILNNEKKLIQDDREDWKKIRRSRF